MEKQIVEEELFYKIDPQQPKEIMAAVEALLFAAGDPVPFDQMAEVLEMDKDSLKQVLEAMLENQGLGGIMLREINNCYTLCTRPEFEHYIRTLVEPRSKQGLSPAALETLSIIAYNQPITRARVEEIRGVNSDSSVNRLLEKSLIKEAGRMEVPGRPMLFETTETFLKSFGFSSLNDLPELDFQEINEFENQTLE